MKDTHSGAIKAFLIASLIIWIATYCTASADIYLDIYKHANWAKEINLGNFTHFFVNFVSYPLWHIIVKILNRIFCFSLYSSAAGATALFNCFALWSVLFVWNRMGNKTMAPNDMAFWSVCLLFVGPLSAPWFNKEYYLGQGTGNIWHNPTNIAVKGFAILAFYIIVHLLKSTETKTKTTRYYIALSILLFLSALAKPSFLQGMIPGLGLYFILHLIGKGFKQNILHFFKIALCFVPATCLLFVQFLSSFFFETSIAEGNGIGIAFGYVLHAWSPNLLISFILAFAFPIFVFSFNYKTLCRKTSVQLVICYELMAWLESAFLYEIGPRSGDGNWLWGSYLSMFIVWMVALIHFWDIIQDDTTPPSKRHINLLVGISLFALHLLFGICFWYKLSIFH